MKYLKIISIALLSGLFIVTSCTKDLDTIPLDDDVTTSATFYQDAQGYRQVIAKLYAGLALTGQDGPAGNGDLVGIDEGFSSYLRNYWKSQELPTDEAVNGWADDGLPDFSTITWTASNPFVRGMYYRIYFQLTLANEFIREAADSKLDDRGITGDDKTQVQFYRTEARFLRALSYWHALDLFGNVPFITEADKIGSFLPEQKDRAYIFEYLEEELIALEDLMVEPMMNEYGRADKAAVWTLLAKLYLNAEVYTGEPKYTECINYCNKVIEAGYTLHPEYDELFLADNHTCDGTIFSIVFDGTVSQTWGGTTFLISAAVGGSMVAADFGIGGGWGGNRTTSAFVSLFNDETGASDSRAMFHINGQSLEINDISNFNDGYAITKFKNVTSSGEQGSNETYVDTDFHMFRLADVYLMYAEAVLRGGTGGDQVTAKGYIDAIRTRAGNADSYTLDVDFILDERGRELFWECHRRTDLIRFGKFAGGDYLWPWKGGLANGMAIHAKYKLFPIPNSDLNANPNLEQNPDY